MSKKNSVTGVVIVLVLLIALQSNVFALSEGYILTSAYGSPKTVLLDTAGEIAFEWDHDALPNRLSGYSAYLLKNGNLLRTAMVDEGDVISEMAPRQGIIEEIDSLGKVVWRYELANDTFMVHHDIKPMPNGHILAVSFLVQLKKDLIATGVDTILLQGMANPVFMLSEKIIEIDPTAAKGEEIVWEWRMPDHVVKGEEAAAHPELISGTITNALWTGYKQWVHLNGLDYNEKLDMILFSSRMFSELYIIDHSTTTEEAAGHTGGTHGKGGDILYRWGKPSNYKANGGYTINVLHCPNWIPNGYPGAGNVIFFHNNVGGGMGGGMGGGSQSEVIEIALPMNEDGNFSRNEGQPFGPEKPEWIFVPPSGSGFSSQQMSSAFRMPNGNTIAHLAYPAGGFNSGSVITEINKDGQVVWTDTLELKGEAVEENSTMTYNPAKIMYYDENYPGIQALLFGKTDVNEKSSAAAKKTFLPEPGIRKSAEGIAFTNVAGGEVTLYSLHGKKIFSHKAAGDRYFYSTRSLSAGTYIAQVTVRGVRNKVINVTP